MTLGGSITIWGPSHSMQMVQSGRRAISGMGAWSGAKVVGCEMGSMGGMGGLGLILCTVRTATEY